MIDWVAARLDYVTHHELTFADIANKYHASHSTIWNRAAREHWTEQRKAASEKLVEKSRERIAFSQSEQLARCNSRHLALAEKLEEAVNLRLERAPELSENALRNLAVVSEAAQRISRLALGVSTENLHTSHDPYATMSDEELASELSRLGIEPTLQSQTMIACPKLFRVDWSGAKCGGPSFSSREAKPPGPRGSLSRAVQLGAYLSAAAEPGVQHDVLDL